MLLMRLWNYMRGYVIIIVEGYFLEKFINICTHRQIYLWDVRILNNCAMCLKVSIKGFKKVRGVARKSKCRVRIKRKVGLPFILYRYRKRKALFFGLLIFVAIIYTLTSFIWTIEIKGNKIIPSESIIETLDSLGLYVGRFKHRINIDNIVTNMEILIDDVAWIGIAINGTKAEVEIVERVRAPHIVDKDKPCDIIANNDGIVTEITVKSGAAVVKTGDTVKKGQLLVSGTIPSRYEGQEPRLVHSVASVLARTWYEGFSDVQDSIIIKSKTGKKKHRYSLILFGKQINLHRNRIAFDKYEQNEDVKLLSLGHNLQIPIGLIVKTIHEINDVELILSQEQARKLAADTALKAAMDKLPIHARVERTDTYFVEKSDGVITANVVVECIEEIGEQQQM